MQATGRIVTTRVTGSLQVSQGFTGQGNPNDDKIAGNETKHEMFSLALAASAKDVRVDAMTLKRDGTGAHAGIVTNSIKLYQDNGTVGVYEAGTDVEIASLQTPDVTFVFAASAILFSVRLSTLSPKPTTQVVMSRLARLVTELTGRKRVEAS